MEERTIADRPELIKERSFLAMAVPAFFTIGVTGSFFYGGMARDISTMSSVASEGEIPPVKFSTPFSAVLAGFYPVLVFTVPDNMRNSIVGCGMIFMVINAIYIRSKVKAMKKALLETIQYYYDNYVFNESSWLFLSSNILVMAIVYTILLPFAPIIYAGKLTELFNDVARKYNKGISGIH